jgi:excisionase family DNA binding protein
LWPSRFKQYPRFNESKAFQFLPDISRSFLIVTVQSVSVVAQATLAIPKRLICCDAYVTVVRCERGIVMRANLEAVSSNVTSLLSQESNKATQGSGKFEALLDSNEAAELLRIHPKTLQRMARKGEIPAIQIGKLWRFSTSALLLWQQQKLAG